jgi:hypothetical protein
MASCCPPGSLGPAAPPLSSQTALQGRMEVMTPPDDEDHFDLMQDDIQPMPCYVTTGREMAPESAAASTGPSSSDSSSLWQSTNRVIVIFTDVFGLDSGHHKAFADTLAARLNRQNDSDSNNTNTIATTTVVMPDIFRGKPIANAESIYIPVLLQIVWNMVVRFDKESYDNDMVHLIMPWVRRQMNMNPFNNNNNSNIACVGFCFGGWCVARALALSHESEQQQKQQLNNNTSSMNSTTGSGNDNDIQNEKAATTCCFPMKCGIGIHPALKPEAMQQHPGQAQLARRMGRKPVLWLSAGNDELKAGQHVVVQINAASRNIAESDVAIEFPEMVHGWVTRGDGARDPRIAAEQERALQLTVDFIEEHCPV